MKLLSIILGAIVIWIHSYFAIMHRNRKSYIKAGIAIVAGILVAWQLDTVVLDTDFLPEIPFGVNIAGMFILLLNVQNILNFDSNISFETPEKKMCMKAIEMQHEEKEIIISVLKDYAEKHYDKRAEYAKKFIKELSRCEGLFYFEEIDEDKHSN